MFSRTSHSLQRARRQLRGPSSQCLSAINVHRRSLWAGSLQQVSDGFLDLAIALPYPLSWPPYATTIIITTVLSRLVFTLPFSIWAKKRQWRLEEEVLPRLQEYRNVKAREIAMQIKKDGFQGTVEDFKSLHTQRLQTAMLQKRKELFKEFNCSPGLTMAVPAVTQLPLFVASTMLFGHLAQRPTVLDSESFLTLSSLARPDPTSTLPVALGIVTLANVECAHLFSGEDRLAREALIDKRRKEQAAKTGSIHMKSLVQGSLRVFSVLRIVIGVMVDGSVIIYWLTSATFGLFQTWGLNYWDAFRLLRLRKYRLSKVSRFSNVDT